MKRYVSGIIVFVLIFTMTYLTVCFGIPAFGLKLSAPPVVYFIESIKHMSLVKGLISLFFGAIAGMGTMAALKKQ